jgi:hypothetical protein
VPLSEHEQRLLEQMERALYAEDPKFASSLRSSGSRPGIRRSAVTGVLAAIAGVAVLIAGAASGLGFVSGLIGAVGFLLMLVGTYLVIRALRAPVSETPASTPTAAAPRRSGFMDRAEERFRKRREGGEL